MDIEPSIRSQFLSTLHEPRTSVHEPYGAHYTVIADNHVRHLRLAALTCVAPRRRQLHPYHLGFTGTAQRIAKHQCHVTRVSVGLSVVTRDLASLRGEDLPLSRVESSRVT